MQKPSGSADKKSLAIINTRGDTETNDQVQLQLCARWRREYKNKNTLECEWESLVGWAGEINLSIVCHVGEIFNVLDWKPSSE